MKPSFPIGIFIKLFQDKARFKLSVDLFLQRMGELEAGIIFLQLFPVFCIVHWIEWKRVDEGGGKIDGKPGDTFNSFVKNVETKEIEIWQKDSEYKSLTEIVFFSNDSSFEFFILLLK